MDARGSWSYDENAPSEENLDPGLVTSPLEAVKPDPLHDDTVFTYPETGDVYRRVPPDAFPSFDEVDSTTIIDEGAPD